MIFYRVEMMVIYTDRYIPKIRFPELPEKWDFDP